MRRGSPLNAHVKNLLERLLPICLASVLVAAATAYAADYFGFRYRIARNREPYGQMTVRHYYAVEQKNGRTQFIFEPPQQETCVHALFPRAGYPPCWYLRRHTEQRTDI